MTEGGEENNRAYLPRQFVHFIHDTSAEYNTVRYGTVLSAAGVQEFAFCLVNNIKQTNKQQQKTLQKQIN